MEEDAAVKAAPVMRLRRRLSVETEETKSPSAPSTPTKKRAARLAAKPQLELIDEHAVTNSPKRITRKSISRDVAEPEEKAATPARRSTRTKSNTSLVSEADEIPLTPARRSTRIKSNTSLVSEVDEKPSTPARRNTRIKSNTSIVSETVQSVETPRAKRAVARRNSQVGSDTEAPATPARTRRARKASTSSIDKDESLSVSETAVTPGRTRRTRKGSTSSIDTPADAVEADKPSLITEVISEEPEGKLRKSTSNDTSNGNDNEDSPTRKSPRLLAKKGRKSKSEETNETSKQSQESSEETDNLTKPTEKLNKELNVAEDSAQHDLSMSSAKLIEDLDTKLKNKMFNKNKSLSDIEYITDSKKRDRTKSWTTLCVSPKDESNFYSDNESTKKKLKKHGKIFNDKRLSLTEDTGCGDAPKQTSTELSTNEDKEQNLNKSNRNRKSRDKSENLESSIFEDAKEVNISNESNKENLLGVAPVVKVTSAAEILFENVPTADVKSMVFIEDSDSNNGAMEKEIKQINSEDQCVPIVLHQSEKEVDFPEKENDNDPNNIFAINNINNKVTNYDDVEPMDIDETIPDNVSFSKFSEYVENQDIPAEDQNNSETETKKSKKSRKSSLSVALETDNLDKSKRKSTSSLSHSTSENNKVENNEEQNVSMNENTKGKKSSKSLAKETDNNLTENINKSKRKSILSNSFSEDKTENTIAQNDEEVVEETTQNKSSRKSTLSIAQDGDDNLKVNKSKRKSSLSNSMDHEKTNNESRSTLVLSQLKDVSAAENSASKSPQNTSELSKSINIDEANKEAPINKNLALSYLTSTPVQQKNLQKLAEMNTSVITPTNENKKNNDSSKSTPKKNASMVSKSSDDENSSDEDSEEELNEDEESSKEKSNLFDEEAEDAGEDYESGDSQDEEEREYERENEIIEKGETLTSEEDISNDSDYEKDSFIVDSDEEDNELLSGSGDDLDMSDNELTLSAKSKKKYNERKLKEQKKASREMFEARHGLNESDQKKKNKTSNRNRLDSTLLKSDEDVMPPKKNKRMRLESTMESCQAELEDATSNKDITVASEEDEIGYKKKKGKRLSESVCHDNTMNEREITICSQSTTEKEDPLLQIKTEPKTPIKDLEISRVHVTDDVEQVHVDEDMSILKSNETSDPLQSTVLQDENGSESDDDSISENEEIANNYDSVLKDLNKENEKQIKSHNISLNLDKKAKKTKEPIVEELNLTSTKVSKKDNTFQAKEKSVKRVFKKLADSDESSDSIDLQLLFSDDSNGSADKKVNNISRTSAVGAEESIIPLKRSEAKTDIGRSMEQALSLDISATKKNKKTGADKKTITEDTNEDEGSLNFFIDTKGDLSDKATSGDDAGNESDDAPVEILYVSNKNKNDSVLTKTPTSEKKKNKVPESKESDANVSIAKTSASGKKKKSETTIHDTQDSENKKRISISQDDKIELGTDKVSAGTAKKRKRKSSTNKTTDDIESDGNEDIDTNMLNTPKKFNGSVVGNKNKKMKISTSIDQIEENLSTRNPIVEQTDFKKTKINKKFENKQSTVECEPHTRKSKKRKERDVEDVEKISKVFKENSFDKVHVPRLPTGVIDQLEEISGTQPKNIAGKGKAKVVSTSNFTVEETLKRKNKPSDFLEETVYLNEDESNAVVKKRSIIKKPKVLPFLPTVSTSDSGFTTNFQVNVISQKMEFVARNDEVPNFKNDYLNKKIKKLRTYDLYKKQRNIKLSKY